MKMTIITPCYRIKNLQTIFESLNFDYIEEWIIVYDGDKIIKNPYIFKDNSKISEYVCYNINSNYGNCQRNYGMDSIKNRDTYIYFLDDDNIIHKNLYLLLKNLNYDNIFIITFDQFPILLGNNIEIGKIDTAMFLIHYELCKDVRWNIEISHADFLFIQTCFYNNPNKWLYIDKELCYYNYIK